MLRFSLKVLYIIYKQTNTLTLYRLRYYRLLILVSNQFFSQNQKKMNFYFMKTVNIPVYGNIAVYIKYCNVCPKIDYTLRYLEYMCPVSPPLRQHGLSLLWHP